MTEEEAWALEEEVTKNPPKVFGNGKNSFFAKRKRVGWESRESGASRRL